MTNVINDTKHNHLSNNINWIKVKKIVNNIKCRIFVAKKQGNFRKLKKLQNLILVSKYNKLFAIKQVCKINLNKKILNIDNKIYTNSKKILKLANTFDKISLNDWTLNKSIKNFYIKNSNGKLYTINIFKFIDNILQIIIENTLQPEWKSQFGDYNFLLKKKQSIYAKIFSFQNIFSYKCYQKYILNINIKNFFTNISNKLLINKLVHFSANKLILKWLKANYLKQFIYDFLNNKSNKNYIISVLLLHIIFYEIQDEINLIKSKKNESKKICILIINIDCFIITYFTKKKVIEIKNKINLWLKSFKFNIYLKNISIIDLNKGFNILGFNIKSYNYKKTNKLLLKPNLQSQIIFKKILKEAWKQFLGLSVNNVIIKINFILKQWFNYFGISNFYKILSKIDNYNLIRQYRFTKRTNPKKSYKWIKFKYWDKIYTNINDNWVFNCFLTRKFMYKMIYLINIF